MRLWTWVREPVRVGEKEPGIEAEHQQAGQTLVSGLGVVIDRLALPIHSDREVFRRVRPLDDLKDRDHDRQDDALLHTDREDHDGGHCGDHELAEPCSLYLPKSLDIDQTDANEEHDRREHRLGYVGENPGQEQPDDKHDQRHRQVGDLRTALLVVKDLSLRRAAVHHKCASEPGG